MRRTVNTKRHRRSYARLLINPMRGVAMIELIKTGASAAHSILSRAYL
jgi:hypothetical protein